MSSLKRTPKRPSQWRSLDELENRPEFREFAEREFARPLEHEPPNSRGRRRFMQLMGASFALAGAAGCRWDKEYIVPLARRPQGTVPGQVRVYSTSCEVGGVATGLCVTTYDGRPLKVDGNPRHPSSLGGTTAQHQARILELYDPDRGQTVIRRTDKTRAPSTWRSFEEEVRPVLSTLHVQGGQGLAVLAEPSASPTRSRLKNQLLARFPQARWFDYEPVSMDHVRAGTRLAFGAPHSVTFDFAKAAVVLSLGGDVLSSAYPGSLAYARALARGRVPDQFRMTRLYAVESHFTLFGALADHRLSLRPSLFRALAAALDARLTARLPGSDLGPAQATPEAAFLAEDGVRRFLDAVVEDLATAGNAAVVVAGPEQPPEVHALVCRINALLGSVGTTVHYFEAPDPDRPDSMTALRTLTELASHGKVELLVLLGGNPAFTAPADIPFTSVLAKVPHTVHLGLYDNETSSHVEWYLPQAHPFEAWADGLAHDTTVTLAQPLIEPFYRGRTDTELLSLLIDSEAPSRTLVRETHATLVDTAFRQAVHDGVVADSALDPAEPTLLPLKALDLRPDELGPSVTNGLELEFAADSPVYDGRFANNAWLQELPDSLTKLTWGNAALLSPRTAEQLGIEDGELVTLELQGRRLEVPAMHAPGQARGTVKLSLGYGRRRAGLVGGDVPQGIAPVGSDAYPLRTTKTLYFATGVTLRKTGRKAPVATTQHLHTIDARARHAEGSRLGALVRSATLAEFIGDPGFVENRVHEPPSSDMWAPPVAYEGHRWGLAIDLNRCIGCNACMVACQSENNVPVVGQRNVIKGREMHWLRIDRYYAGDPEDPTVAFQPVACQQCEKAPCEQVCPVGATMHSREGLNDMTYNRCIGTRYCSNNCPYKVRRFNFFNYHIDERQPRERVRLMVYNPEVTVRARGVMEKCTFCVQRIQKAKIVAKNARRPVKDGDIVTACQQACPTDAIVFGDLNDTASRVGRLHGIPRAYALLGELNNQPRVRYLARVRNPNPKLA